MKETAAETRDSPEHSSRCGKQKYDKSSQISAAVQAHHEDSGCTEGYRNRRAVDSGINRVPGRNTQDKENARADRSKSKNSIVVDDSGTDIGPKDNKRDS